MPRQIFFDACDQVWNADGLGEQPKMCTAQRALMGNVMPSMAFGRKRKGNSSRGTPKLLRKIVPKSIRIGQRGINLIETIVDDMGHLWTPTHPASDAGTDGFIELCDHQAGATGPLETAPYLQGHEDFILQPIDNGG
jgi:hypothetical protein